MLATDVTELLPPEPAARLLEFARACKAAARIVALYPSTHPAIQTALQRVAETATRLRADGSKITVLPDTLLLKYLLQDTLGEKGRQRAQSDEEIQAEIIAAYRDAIEGRIDRTELNSVLGQIDFLIEMFERIEGKKSRKKPSEKIAALNHIRGEIVKIAEK